VLKRLGSARHNFPAYFFPFWLGQDESGLRMPALLKLKAKLRIERWAARGGAPKAKKVDKRVRKVDKRVQRPADERARKAVRRKQKRKEDEDQGIKTPARPADQKTRTAARNKQKIKVDKDK
jgi:hypothetical protein